MHNTIERGQIYWLSEALEAVEANGVAHPHVVLQETAINQSRVETIVVCALSTNISRAYEVGNVLLDPGEGGLERQSFIAVGQVSAVPKTSFARLIGHLSEERITQALDGIAQRANKTVRRTNR